MRLAWFSPLSPRISGLATYCAAIVAALAPDADIDVFVDDGDPADLAPRLGGSVAVRTAHDFVWMQARRPYDLTVYQLANAASHAYLWGYAVRYPGLAVLHDQVMHHARGAHLRRAHRRRDYRAEVGYDRPDLEASIPAVADLAVPHLLATWPLVRPILATARRCVVHDSAAADDLRGRYPEGRVDVVRYGVTPPAGGRLRRAGSAPVVFAALPHTACVRRLREILRALARVRRETPATLRVLGPCEDDVDLPGEIRAAGLDAGAVAGPEASWGGSGRGRGTSLRRLPLPRQPRRPGDHRHVAARPGRRARDGSQRAGPSCRHAAARCADVARPAWGAGGRSRGRRRPEARIGVSLAGDAAPRDGRRIPGGARRAGPGRGGRRSARRKPA